MERSPGPWRNALAAGMALFLFALLFSVVIAPRPSPAATGAVELTVAAGSDDAEQLVSGWLGLTSSDLELVDEFAPQSVGIRFAGVPIPPGATVESAHIRFTVDEPGNGPAALQIAAHDVGDAPTFSAGAPVIGRSVTAAVDWSPPPWTTVGLAGVDQETSDLATVVQTVVDRPDWSEGSAIAFIISGSGTRTAGSFESGAPPVLVVVWSTDPVTTTTSTSVPPTTTTTTTTTTTVPPTTTTVPPTTTTTTTVPNATSGVVQVRVSASNDDAEQLPSGYVYATSSDLELTQDGGIQTVGLRFAGVDVPRGANILHAWIQFTSDERSTGTADLTLQAHDAGDPAPFGGNGDIGGRPFTTARIAWNPPDWVTIGTAEAAQRTPELIGIVQALVDRPDWSRGNAMAFVVTGTGRRTAESFDGSPSAAPLLHVEWTIEDVPPPVNGVPGVSVSATSTGTGGMTVLEAIITDDGLPNPPGATAIFWQQIGGPAAVTIPNPTAATTSAVLPVAGVYTFRATVDDGDLQSQGQVTTTATDPIPPAETIRLAVIGDFGGSNARMQGLANQVDSLSPDAVVTVGDNVYASNGFDRLVGRYFHDYIGGYSGSYGFGSHANRFFPALGNHDYDDGGIGNYEAFFELPGVGVPSTNSSGNERYYDARIGDVHVFILNSNPEGSDGLTPATIQGRWLQAAMQGSDAEWKIVVLHNPPYSSLPGKAASWMRWPFQAWGADLVLSGDAHAYERLSVAGLPYVINGLGINNTTLDRPRVPESEAFWSQDTPAVLLIEACAGALHTELHPVGYGVVDPFTIGSGTCP